MKKHMDFGASLAVSVLMTGALMLTSSVTAAQTAQTKPTASTAIATPISSGSNSIASAHQDQFGHASGAAVANASTQQSAGPQEARKHIAGVKYEDRTASPSNSEPTGQLDAKGIQEKSSSSNTSGTATSNAMAIKENGSSSKPSTKPNQ